MMVLLTTILGALTGILPSILKIFDRKQELEHERQMLELRLDAAAKKVNLEIALEDFKASAREGESLRKHDSSLRGNKFIEALRASVRPVITYIFFFMFVIIKGSAAYVMLNNGMDIPSMLAAVWDEWTLAIFGSIMGFWFGSRAFEKWLNVRD
jgi:hypothetical protein